MDSAAHHPDTPSADAPAGRRLTRALAWALALALLAAVFGLYFQPTLLVALSEQLWACFN